MDWSALVVPLCGGPTTPAGFWAAAGVYALLFLALFGLFWLLFRNSALASEDYDLEAPAPSAWALKCAMLVHHMFVGPLSMVAALQDPAIVGVYACFGCAAEAENLLSVAGSAAAPASIQALMPITAGYMIADLVLLPTWNLSAGSAAETVLMVVHHVVSLLVWPLTLFHNYCARYVLILLVYEISSIFLTVNWLLSNSGRKRSTIYKVNGLLFTASFVVVRMLGALPQLRALWEVPPWSPANVREKADVDALASYQLLSLYTLIIPHALNLFWGVKVVRGFVAVMTRRDPKGAGQEKAFLADADPEQTDQDSSSTSASSEE